MKKILILFIIFSVLAPFFTLGQFVREYRPNGSPNIFSTVNLVSVVEATATPVASSRAINTIEETPSSGIFDVCVVEVDAQGNGTFGRRYGLPQTNETAATLIRCPDSGFIYAATTNYGGKKSAWLFRTTNSGVIVWSKRYFANGLYLNVSSFCIKKTNESAENYIVAANISGKGFSRLLVFKIDAGGVLVWNQQYIDASPSLFLSDQPKSMIIKQDTIIIAGNRSTVYPASSADLFVIGINQATAGVITHPYRVIKNINPDNINPDEKDPFINFGLNNEYVLTYQCIAKISGVTTGRIAFTRLNSSLDVINATSSLLWESNTINSFGHSIYNPNLAVSILDIGGGTTLPGSPLKHNPLFLKIDNNGMPVAGSYRRLWQDADFNSTFMMRDAFVTNNRYEHHNFKQSSGQNSMSLLRNDQLCYVSSEINHQNFDASARIRKYNIQVAIIEGPYELKKDYRVPGTIYDCCPPAGRF
jgi:hypothetical protein